MPATPEGANYNFSIEYYCDQRTGKIEITVGYASADGTDFETHESYHRKLVLRLLQESGLLQTEGRIRMRRHGEETVYDAVKVNDEWKLNMVSHTVIPVDPDPVQPTPVDPTPNPSPKNIENPNPQ